MRDARGVTDLDALTADQLRALHVRTTSDVVRRAIKRRLQQLADLPEPPAVTRPPANEPQMKKAEYRSRLLALRPPTTRPWWSLAQITEALDRTTAEWHERSKEGK